VYRLAGLLLGDQAEAEDATQEALLRAWRSAGTLRDRIGVIAVDFQSDSGSVTHTYRTIDAGSSWTDVEAFPTGFYWVSVIDQQHWVAISDSAVRRTDDGGATWRQTAAVPPTSHDAGPQFADDNDGWWLAGDNLTAALYATSDGGATWKALAP
jgi:photosystem II stability/assembly factor-like uncharacterized protein